MRRWYEQSSCGGLEALRIREWEAKREGTADALFALHDDRAAVQLHDLARRGQPDPRARDSPGGVRRPPKPIEYVREVVARDPHPLVAHAQDRHGRNRR